MSPTLIVARPVKACCTWAAVALNAIGVVVSPSKLKVKSPDVGAGVGDPGDDVSVRVHRGHGQVGDGVGLGRDAVGKSDLVARLDVKQPLELKTTTLLGVQGAPVWESV
ncbi:hypothetical protein LCGC14_2092310 [marine sediment metagenome]|uniref:Uncharacterized protein n=1 Tax=marine sediment metagenome TaxID=412755 RepID=A0A0F9GQE5_9ZZZZ